MNTLFAVLLMAVAVLCGAGTIGPGLGSNSTSSTCGGNCPGGCASCPCGTTKSAQSVSTWCSKYSWNQVKKCADQSYSPPLSFSYGTDAANVLPFFHANTSTEKKKCSELGLQRQFNDHLLFLLTTMQKNCQCIMNAESAGNANAVNQNSGGSYDVGLWYR